MKGGGVSKKLRQMASPRKCIIHQRLSSAYHPPPNRHASLDRRQKYTNDQLPVQEPDNSQTEDGPRASWSPAILPYGPRLGRLQAPGSRLQAPGSRDRDGLASGRQICLPRPRMRRRNPTEMRVKDLTRWAATKSETLFAPPSASGACWEREANSSGLAGCGGWWQLRAARESLLDSGL